jgi:hypothetical protein
MGRLLLYAVPTVIVLYSLIDAIQSRRDDVRLLPKWLWLIVILVVPLLGAFAWLYAGRPSRASATGSGSVDVRRGPIAPDDDPTFLRTLDDASWSQRMRQRRESDAPQQPAPPSPAPPASPTKSEPDTAVDDAAGTTDTSGSTDSSGTTDSADH